ncbi:hypothetical protein IAC76_07410, partial [Spirochaetes bacterium]|nr:hypothetical protein [Candidatus Scatousia excrementipullorum]
DTMRLARKFCKFSSHRLSYLAEQFEISTEGHHRALNDCIMTFEIYKKIKTMALNIPDNNQISLPIA